MKQRNINPEWFQWEELWTAERKHKLPLAWALLGLHCAADRDGKLWYKPMQLRWDIFPTHRRIDVEKIIAVLVEEGFVHRYDVNGDTVLIVDDFEKWQKPNHRERKSRIPDPPWAKPRLVAKRAVVEDVPFVVSNQRQPWFCPRDLFDDLVDANPRVDVKAEMKKAAVWCVANPTRQKTSRGMGRFLNNWMLRAGDANGNGQPVVQGKDGMADRRTKWERRRTKAAVHAKEKWPDKWQEKVKQWEKNNPCFES